MKHRIFISLLVFVNSLHSTPVEELIELKEAGFNDGEILELVKKESAYKATDLITLKNSGFSKGFILDLRKIPINSEKVASGGSISPDDQWNKLIDQLTAKLERGGDEAWDWYDTNSEDALNRQVRRLKQVANDMAGAAKDFLAELKILDKDSAEKISEGLEKWKYNRDFYADYCKMHASYMKLGGNKEVETKMYVFMMTASEAINEIKKQKKGDDGEN